MGQKGGRLFVQLQFAKWFPLANVLFGQYSTRHALGVVIHNHDLGDSMSSFNCLVCMWESHKEVFIVETGNSYYGFWLAALCWPPKANLGRFAFVMEMAADCHTVLDRRSQLLNKHGRSIRVALSNMDACRANIAFSSFLLASLSYHLTDRS